MGAVFDDFAVLQDEDAVGEANGAEAVADEDGGCLGSGYGIGRIRRIRPGRLMSWWARRG